MAAAAAAAEVAATAADAAGGGGGGAEGAAAAGTVRVEDHEALVAELLKEGPLYASCFGAAADAESIRAAEARGRLLAEILFGEGAGQGRGLRHSEAVRIYQYYLPLYQWILNRLDKRREKKESPGAAGGPLFVGLTCPQGGGKTTLVTALTRLFSSEHLVCAALSIDDFYLTHAEQNSLAERHPGNPLLQLRGNFGSHDTALATATLEALASGRPDVLLPRYTKSAHQGRGDRAPESEWERLAGAADVVLLEGWCLGFSPLAAEDLRDPALEPVNEYLGGAYRALHRAMDAWVVIQIDSPRIVYRWREQAEEAMRAEGRPAMTPEQVKDFADRYMPAYEHYLPGLYRDGPDGAAAGAVLRVRVDDSRSPVAAA